MKFCNFAVMKTKSISPAFVFAGFNLFATLLIIVLTVKEKLPVAGLPLTYVQMQSLWPNDFTPSGYGQNQVPQEQIFFALPEKRLKDVGLVNVKELDTSIVVDLKYSSTDNFLLTDVYGDLNECYLQKEAAEKLSKAQEILHEKYPFYNLVVFDGVRPLSIQKTMWESLKIPADDKRKFLASPWEKSLHNFGAAVDVSIVNSDGWEIDMGTPYDYFGELGYPVSEDRMLQEGKLMHRQKENRKLLRDVMTKAGFLPIATEWWHFNFCTRAEAVQKYELIK